MNAPPRAGFFSGAPGFRAATLGALGLLAVATAGCEDLTLESRWRDREVRVDGRLTEWEGATQYLEEQRVSVGLLNDGSHLYLSLSTPDPALHRQVLAPGFTIRLSPEGSGGRSLGIRFPLGLGDDGPPRRHRNREGAGEGPPLRERGEAPDLETLVRRYQGSGVEMEILTKESTNSEENVVRLGVEEARGIAVALGNMQGTLVYELQVPLTGGGDILYAVGLDSKTLDLKLETAVPNREEARERMGRGPPPGGGLGGGGGPGGGMRGGGPPGGMPMGGPGSLDVRAKVHLATGGSE